MNQEFIVREFRGGKIQPCLVSESQLCFEFCISVTWDVNFLQVFLRSIPVTVNCIIFLGIRNIPEAKWGREMMHVGMVTSQEFSFN